jgi:hypothetical protein
MAARRFRIALVLATADASTLAPIGELVTRVAPRLSPSHRLVEPK